MSWIRHKTRQPVRPLIGRLGCWREKLSIQTHLAYCEFKLRLRTGSTQTARLQLLDILHRYWRAGRFPQNNLRTPGRQPIFIDDAGVHCAVGYLMAQTGAEDLANAINQSDRFVYLEDLDLDRQPAIRAWLDQQGLKPAEAALIQPTYGPCGFGGGAECLGTTYVNTGMSAGDIVLAIISIIFSLGLLLPTVSLILLSPRSWSEKWARFLQSLGGLVMAGVLTLLPLWLITLLRDDLALSFYLVAATLGITACLVVVWLIRLIRGRPMIGFNPETGRYRIGFRILFYVLGFVLLGNLLPVIHSLDTMPSAFIYINLLLLVALPLLLVHRPFAGVRPRLARWLSGAFLASILVLAVIVPSPIYTLEQITSQGNANCGSGSYYWISNTGHRQLSSCLEVTGGLPKVFSPQTWVPLSGQDPAGNPRLY